MKTKLLSLLLLFAMSVGYAQRPVITSVAITGGSVGGWSVDGVPDPQRMETTDNIHWTLNNVEITAVPAAGQEAGIKFRANNAWSEPTGYNWGSNAFPTGTAVYNGPNIMGVPGIYSVTFNSETGEFHFEGPPVPVVKLVGAAVPAAEGVLFTTTDAVNYTASNVTLLSGDAQFNVAIEDVSINFGDTTFPEGEAIEEGVMIPVVAGTYSTITYNLDDGAYVFTAAPVYPLVSIIGSGASGWGTDVDLTTTDGETYRGTVTLIANDGVDPDSGNIKFRSNHNWNDPNWGGVAFPTGPTEGQNGNIVVTTAGTYDVTFTRSTGAYTFYFPQISLIGEAFGGWTIDHDLTTTDGANYSIASITAAIDQEAKFRSNHSWDAPNVTYGSTSFPSGTVTSPGSNIQVLAGTYGVTLNRVTGAFNFGAPLATNNFNTTAFTAYPNPTHNSWNFDAAKQTIESIQIVDVLGKTVINVTPKATTVSVDASALNTGVYFARIATATATKTVKVVKN